MNKQALFHCSDVFLSQHATLYFCVFRVFGGPSFAPVSPPTKGSDSMGRGAYPGIVKENYIGSA